jgi:hypothetical protein
MLRKRQQVPIVFWLELAKGKAGTIKLAQEKLLNFGELSFRYDTSKFGEKSFITRLAPKEKIGLMTTRYLVFLDLCHAGHEVGEL